MSGFDFTKLMDMANQLKTQLNDAQQKALALRVTGEAGAGLVRVTMNGRYEVIEVHIESKALSPTMGTNDVSLLEDLMRAAFNAATQKVGESLKEGLGGMAQQFGLDTSALDFLNKDTGGQNK